MSRSNDERRSDAPHRGFRFFFWVSATLFFLAGANWLFNLYIGISGSISYLLGLAVLIFAIFLVAGLLNAAYTFIPNIRVILDGVLGLSMDNRTEPAHTSETKTTSRVGQKFDKENKGIELKKAELAFEEYRSSYYMALGQYFAVLLVIIAGFITLSVSVSTVGILIADVGFLLLLFTGIYVATIVRKTIEEYQRQRPKLDELIEDIENGLSVGTVTDALRRLQGKNRDLSPGSRRLG